MSTLVGKNIVKRYGKDTVLKNVDINIETGKIYGLIGRNGAGKTTLLSILTAQNPASEGTVTLDGEPVDSFSEDVMVEPVSLFQWGLEEKIYSWAS